MGRFVRLRGARAYSQTGVGETLSGPDSHEGRQGADGGNTSVLTDQRAKIDVHRCADAVPGREFLFLLITRDFAPIGSVTEQLMFIAAGSIPRRNDLAGVDCACKTTTRRNLLCGERCATQHYLGQHPAHGTL